MTSYFAHTTEVCLFVRVRAHRGTVGEAFVEPGDTVEPVGAILHNAVAPAVRGAGLLGHEWLWERGRDVAGGYSHWYERDVRAARGCIEVALWDAIGKALGVPLWRLWGAVCGSGHAVWIGGYYGSEVEPEIESMRERDAAGVEFTVGWRSPEDADRGRRPRAVGRDDFVLIVDANRGSEAPFAVRFARFVVDRHVRRFEELSRRDYAIRAHMVTGLPVAGGRASCSRGSASNSSPQACRCLQLRRAVGSGTYGVARGGVVASFDARRHTGRAPARGDPSWHLREDLHA